MTSARTTVASLDLFLNHGIKAAPHEEGLLGRITFSPPCIDVFRQPEYHEARDRFTLAHELAHYLLGHEKFVNQEWCDRAEVSLNMLQRSMETDIDRLEWQANYFASCLLMPRDSFLVRYAIVWSKLDLRKIAGRPAIFIDHQPCNIATLRTVLAALVKTFCVSRQAAEVRLRELNLLVDRR